MLIDDIIQILQDEHQSLTSALLKTKVLLNQIGKPELAQWVNSEIDGYPDGAAVPEYRILPGTVPVRL